VLASLEHRPSVPPPVAPGTTTPSLPDDTARLARVPVTRLTPEPAMAAAPPPVQPDPLTPRLLGTGTLPTSQSRRPPPTASRHVRGPVVPTLPIAGYEKGQPPSDAGAVVALAAAATTGVQQRDLEPVATPDPAYPPAAFRQGVAGWVEVEYTVNERGATTDLAVVAAEPRGVFDDAAVAAVADWKYRPRIVNGRPVAQRTSVTLHFSVEK
jgi:protein TonB